nr:MAG TPA: Tail associated lysozyme [Caudoviricetes sp.]
MSFMKKPPWIVLAEQYIGTREIRGPRHEPKILQWWRKIRRGGIQDDETPWCSAFVGAMFEDAGITSTRFESARSWETWGRALSRPTYGCVVTFTRAGGGGHVGFIIGQDVQGNLLVLGGNQNNEVRVSAFSPARVTAYRWPANVPLEGNTAPPLMAAVAPSTSEA